MCDEMMVDDYMETYVMETAVISRCNAISGEGCSDKEKDYIAKYNDKGIAEVASQYDRLEDMNKQEGAKQSINGYKWLAQRRAILKQLKKAGQDL